MAQKFQLYFSIPILTSPYKSLVIRVVFFFLIFRTSKLSSGMVTMDSLAEEWEKTRLSLRDYQKEGVDAMYSWYKAGHGGINGDEMGLGKTCQAIVLMMRLLNEENGPFLVLSPLSVCEHWVSEIQRFSCDELDPIGYFGYAEERANILVKLGKLKKNSVFIIPYHLFRSEPAIVRNLQASCHLKFNVVIVDEAQAIKNQDCVLAENLKPYNSHAWFLLMTGTPIQNNLDELFSLLTFVDSAKFSDTITSRSDFVSKYKEAENIDTLKGILSKYMIRRTKDVVYKNLLSCDQVIIYHNITEL
ncbi:hypothetical protein KIN20_032774 [Parelaphostrongylus tenuis]|uniref:Helicase ATP-binding domain-containing protein n=1 Tax=Parelaphostrongylus tenuis TaxID=148309 RepID=A0AAD5WHX4_PARTN|nr:hypothetical protein KIN20_032774 [Parelaphostrongylus tenuis]